ncbi:glycosyltransferase family 2 protein [Ferrimonas balearica]|uniref:glycosyltransferase family 2 protein n=1 Tax=Ferrimonas balearica TaxID=44012 RepID=UPI001C99AF5F|nr:glycosyltransferase [Ferrimonas balearica]MBY5921255.1 glycosyltransferase [Ferrimonas balearica]MBY5996060.1 glycosyltransferase [Ferrimonas balearica]
MTIKARLKGILAKYRNLTKITYIDFVYQDAKGIVLVGWVASKESVLPEHLEYKVGARNVQRAFFVHYPRADVCQHLGLSADRAAGFVTFIPGAHDPKALMVGLPGALIALKKRSFAYLTSLGQVLKQAGNGGEAVKAFLEKELGDVKSNGSLIIPARKLDKDVEAIKAQLQQLKVHQEGFIEEAQALLPGIHKIWKARQSARNDAQLLTFGAEVESPRLSIVVPIYGRYDFMQHQLAQFSSDPSFKDVELIYVLDDPSLIHEVKVTSFGLFETFRHPFKVVLSERNLGFSGANNLGVSFARSEMLLLLNSDIIPRDKGWIDTYLEQFASTEDCGILGATLVYEDDTIQHAGMEFRQDSTLPGLWVNHHPLKGVPLKLAEHPGVCPSQMVTGACMLMKRSVYQEVEGFDTLYVLGDFEDSDLCLKVRDKGLGIYLSGSVVLYHLERLSQNLVDPGDWKFKLTMVNGAYQLKKWKNKIEEMVTRDGQ